MKKTYFNPEISFTSFEAKTDTMVTLSSGALDLGSLEGQKISQFSLKK